MAPPLGPPVSAPRDPVSPADDDDEDEEDLCRSRGAELDLIIRRTGTAGAIDGITSTIDLDDENDQSDSGSSSSLQDRLVKVMAAWPKSSLQRVAPIQVATELGISVEDATAELCHLMSVVGNDCDGATFSFERLPPPPKQPPDPSEKPIQPGIDHHLTMVFMFPTDFQQRFRRNRRRSELKDVLRELGILLFKTIKVVTALGLFLSLLIVGVAALVAAVTALVAMTRYGGGGHGNAAGGSRYLRQHVRTACDAFRNCLWCYAVFMPGNLNLGNGAGPNTDPFFRSLAADLSLLCGCLRGNPFSVWYWLHFRQRMRRQRQHTAPAYHGIHRMGRWGSADDERGVDSTRYLSDSSGSSSADYASALGGERGLLSVAAEFLFGPTPFAPGPTPAERWRLRARVIVDASARGPVSLADLSPFVDDPPASLLDHPKVVGQGLLLVSHFRGIPSLSTSKSSGTAPEEDVNVRGSPQSTFVFPELLAESSFLSGSLLSVDGSNTIEPTWTKNLLYDAHNNNIASSSALPSNSAPALGRGSSAKVPSFLVERQYQLTTLTQQQFVVCAILVTINGLGVFWLRQSLCGGGVLQMGKNPTQSAVGYLLCRIVVPVLHFYSIVFVAIPLARLALIALWNVQIQRRNRRRRSLAQELNRGATPLGE